MTFFKYESQGVLSWCLKKCVNQRVRDAKMSIIGNHVKMLRPSFDSFQVNRSDTQTRVIKGFVCFISLDHGAYISRGMH